MSNQTKIQLRGHCPCCGREQAVLSNGRMSKHGYTVENGWFQGVCTGDSHQPMEVDASTTLALVERIVSEVAELKQKLYKMEKGLIKPTQAASGPWYKAPMVPFAEAPSYQQQDAVNAMIRNTKYRVKQGIEFGEWLLKVLFEVHGQALKEVNLDTKAPERVLIGETRVLPKGHKATVVRVQGARVYWKDERGFNSWTGTTSWRKLEKI